MENGTRNFPDGIGLKDRGARGDDSELGSQRYESLFKASGKAKKDYAWTRYGREKHTDFGRMLVACDYTNDQMLPGSMF